MIKLETHTEGVLLEPLASTQYVRPSKIINVFLVRTLVRVRESLSSTHKDREAFSYFISFCCTPSLEKLFDMCS